MNQGLSFRVDKIKLRNFLVVATLVFSICAIVFSQFSHKASAAPTPESCFAFDSATGTITNYYKHEGNNLANPACPKDVEIPSSIGGVAVTAIGEASNFWNPSSATSFAHKSLTSVTIPDSVTSIGDYAFYFNQLTSITIPSSVTYIGNTAFHSNQLTSVTIPDSVTYIGNTAFQSNQLTSVTIPNSVTSIGEGAFSENQLTNVTIPDSVTSIGDYAFSNNQLTTLTIPDSVTSIGDGAFSFNQLTTVTIPDSVTSIGDYAFSSNQLTTLTIPNSVTSIGDCAFCYNQLTTVTIQGNPSIGGGAFSFQGMVYDDESGAIDISNILTTLIYAPNMTTVPPNELLRESDGYYDLNEDGDMDDIISVVLYNPTPLTIRYLDEQGNSLRPDQTLYGEGITNQLASTLETLHPGATAADLANIYFFSGSNTTQTPPSIDGYTTPAAKTHSFTAGQNTLSFIYQALDNSQTPGEDANSGNTEAGGLADTGGSVYLLLAIATTSLLAGAKLVLAARS